MSNLKKRFIIWTCLLAVLSFASCQDAWKEHNELKIQALDKTLTEQISSDAKLSTFYSYLVKTGYDKVLASSKAYTVWAPVNDALKDLDVSIVNDEARLKAFVGNHISNQSYFTSMPKPSLIIRALNGKNVRFTSSKFEDGAIVDADLYVKNGVLHTVNTASLPRPNAWEFLQSSTAASKQYEFIAALERTEIDTTNGVRLYTDPVTGKTVFQDGTTFPVQRNIYFQRISDLSSEDSLITCIILTDAAFEQEKAKLSPYYTVDDPLLADTLAKWSAVRDLVINGVFEIDDLPDSLTSVTGVQVHLDKSAIVETRLLSNGIAYVVNSVGYKLLENKIPAVIVQGEMTDSIRAPRTPLIKIQKNPNGSLYTHIQSPDITSSPSPLYHYRYKTSVHSTKYAVYWRSINDFYSTPFSMALSFSGTSKYTADLPGLGYHEVPPYDPDKPSTFGEVYLGEITFEHYGNLYAFLASSLGASSAAPTALSLDYIKLVPVN